MKKFGEYCELILLGFLLFLAMIWLFGFFIGFVEPGCETGRVIADNWFTGFGYQLSCKR